jgi:hypothetical protein
MFQFCKLDGVVLEGDKWQPRKVLLRVKAHQDMHRHLTATEFLVRQGSAS